MRRVGIVLVVVVVVGVEERSSNGRAVVGGGAQGDLSGVGVARASAIAGPIDEVIRDLRYDRALGRRVAFPARVRVTPMFLSSLSRRLPALSRRTMSPAPEFKPFNLALIQLGQVGADKTGEYNERGVELRV